MAMDAAKSGRPSPPTAGIAAACVLISVAFKIFLVARNAFPFNADEAVVGLMARHILTGEWPTFFYGQAYLGTTDAFLAAAGFAVFGPQVGVIRAVQVLLYAATVATTVVLAGRAGLGSWGQAAAGLLMAVPVVNTTLYTTVSIGGYGEALLLGNLILLLTLTLAQGRPRLWWCSAWGMFAGFAFWTFGLTLVYTAPAILYLATRWKDASTRVWIARGGALTAGFILGAAPMVAWAGTHGLSTLMRELLGSAIAGASSAQFGEAVWVHLRNFIFFGPSVILGARPPWAITPLAWPLLPLALVFWVVALYLWFRRREPSIAPAPLGELLAGVGLTLLAGFLLTPFGADPSGRYFLPLSVVLAIAGAAMVNSIWMKVGGRWAALSLAVPLVFALWGNLETAFTQPAGLTTQFDASTIRDNASDRRLIEFLRTSGETRGYTTYWVAYPLAFLSDETLIFVPRLPYHADLRYTPRDDRYAPYDDLVDASPRVAYITSRHPQLDEALREGLQAHDVLFEEAEIGGYHIFYRLSRALAPSELDIGLP